MPTPAPKHDIVFQSDDGGTPGTWAAALVVDDSGNGNTLTQGVTGNTKGYILAASAGDFTVTPEFSVTLRINHNTGNTNGYIYSRQNAGSGERHGIRMDGADVDFVINNSVVLTHTLTGLPGSGGDDLLIMWSGRPNPLTTGASDAVHNVFRIWNETDGTVSGGTFSSAVASDLGAADLVFGGRNTGIATQDYSGEVIDIAYGTRFHSPTEQWANWIGTPAAFTPTGRTPIEVPMPDAASGFGNEDELVGPVFALTAASARRNGLLTASPLVNAIPGRSLPTFLDGDPLPLRWTSTNVPASGADTWYWIGQLTYYPPAARNCNRLKVHLHIQYTDPQGDDTLVRVFSMNAHPDRLDLALPTEQPADTLEYYYATATIDAATDDGNATIGGSWYAFDPIKIARAPGDEHTLIGIAVLPASGGPDYRIRAVHVEPLVVDDDEPGDGLDLG